MNAGKRSILFIVQHRFNRSGGQRFRCEQYLPFLQQAGFEWEYSPLLINEQEDLDFYRQGNYIKKLLLLMKGLFRRTRDVLRASRYDIVFVYREAFMTGTTIFERLLKRSGAKLVFDFDDAIWNFDVSDGNKNLGWLKRPAKVNELIGMADLVLAGSAPLALHARRYSANVEVVPSVLDLTKYRIDTVCNRNGFPVTIGWCGSVTTIKHFTTIIPVLLVLKNRYGDRIKFSLYGVNGYTCSALGIRSIPFHPDTEVAEIAAFDIGIMPLPDNEWTRGKCGMKGLQYMSLGIPAVMQAVGANLDIICNGENGYLAGSETEWFNKLSALIESATLREKLGLAGRKTIEEFYSVDAQAKLYVNRLLTLCQQRNKQPEIAAYKSSINPY